MANILEIHDAAKRAIAAYKKINSLAVNVLPEEINAIVMRHARIAFATAFIPIGGLDIVAATANIWTMYISINNALGLKFSDHIIKSIGSAVVSNIVQNVGLAAVVASLKWSPLSWPFSVAILTSSLYALTIVSGWIYLTSLANMAQYDNDVNASVKATLKDQADIKRMYDKIKKN